MQVVKIEQRRRQQGDHQNKGELSVHRQFERLAILQSVDGVRQRREYPHVVDAVDDDQCQHDAERAAIEHLRDVVRLAQLECRTKRKVERREEDEGKSRGAVHLRTGNTDSEAQGNQQHSATEVPTSSETYKS